MRISRGLLLAGLILGLCEMAISQRIYAPHSVLASGSWFKVSTRDPGVYKIDIPLLQALGAGTQNISSNSVRIFGNGGAMLPEANNAPRTDDLQEIAIHIEDGGDGVLNGTDHILFYADGPQRWTRDSMNQRFTHSLNLYSDLSYYFISIGGMGKRIPLAAAGGQGGITVSTFNGRFFHELDTFNFLSSGKEWYGEEFSGAPGKTLVRNFPARLPQVIGNSTITLRTGLLARSVGAGSRFDIKINNQPAGQAVINPVSGGIYDPLANETVQLTNGVSLPGDQSIEFSFVPGSFNAQGWMNWFEVFYRGNISLSGRDQLLFRDWASVGAGQVEYIVAGANAATQVWDITEPSSPIKVTGTFSGSDFRFTGDASRLREYIAFNPSNYLIPSSLGKISGQDLHHTTPADLLIVTHPSLISQAERLASIHLQHDGTRSVVATTEQIFNEFSSGIPDPVAVRDFVKMYYDKYGNVPANRPRYLLLFGDASFDPRGRIFPGALRIPAYQNDFSLDPLNTYTSDDFFGFLDDNEDISSGVVMNLLDAGIGRIPARNIDEAKNFVDKIESYLSPASLGPWRTQLCFIADDEDNNLHLQDAEQITATAATTSSLFNRQKIYLDAYHQESGAGGARYPQANQASNNLVYNGTLIWNYNGHGGPRRLAEETIIDQETVNQWNNRDKLPLFITATCDFAPYDQPATQSLGENILLRPKTGAIAMMTTTRLVFAFSNRVMNDHYIRYALEADMNGNYRKLGDAVRETKNFTYQNFPDISNNRKFTLLGDPALSLAFPQHRIRISSINGIPAASVDTLSAAENVVIEGELTDQTGNLLNAFNGTVYPSVFDKPLMVQTLGNDPGSPVTGFQVQQNLLFRGKASVTNGRFQFSFKVPKDINFVYGNGRLSVYAENGDVDAAGAFTNFIVGGPGTGFSNDDEGPQMKAYLNDEMFVNGGIVNENPVLIVRLSDSSGINTTGLGIGHDIVATLDHDNRKYFILNDFYQAEMNSYREGKISFQLPPLEPGLHTLTIKAWDAMNNSSEITLEFLVAKDEELLISHVLNYPNPFTTSTQFWFEHNKPGQPLQVQIQVMTMTGRIIKTFSETITTSGNRYAGFQWDGRDEFGDRPGKGVYIYKLSVKAPGGLKKEKIEKLVIF